MTARVRGVTAALAAGSMFSVSGSMSTKTGRPAGSHDRSGGGEGWMGTMTSSPGPSPSASRARCSPAVAELTATASTPPPRKSTKARSKRCALGPVVIQPERRLSTTSAISSSPDRVPRTARDRPWERQPDRANALRSCAPARPAGCAATGSRQSARRGRSSRLPSGGP